MLQNLRINQSKRKTNNLTASNSIVTDITTHTRGKATEGDTEVPEGGIVDLEEDDALTNTLCH